MPIEEIFRVAGQSLLFAGLLFLVRWWALTRGKDRTSCNRRIALVLVVASMTCTVAAIILG